jgi:hypothetical protein
MVAFGWIFLALRKRWPFGRSRFRTRGGRLFGQTFAWMWLLS